MTRSRRPAFAAVTVALATVAATLVPTGARAATPATPPDRHASAPIEGFAPYQPQFFCRHTVEPGVAAFERLVLRTYPATHSDGDMRACSDGGTSEHKDGRAWDWGVDHRVPAQRAAGQALLSWLFATDAAGDRDANVRRLGLMYVIWDKRIWGAWDQRWEPYACSGVTACHVDHLHVSFGWAGAEEKTSYWTGHAAPVAEPPLPHLTTVGRAIHLDLPASAGAVTARVLLVGGDTYRLTATGTWHSGSTVADALCRAGGGAATVMAGGALAVGGDQLRAGGRQGSSPGGSGPAWTPVGGGSGCSSQHAYRMTLTPAATTTLTLTLPRAGAHPSGTLHVAVAREAG